MAQNGDSLNLDSLALSDTEAGNKENLFASPSQKRPGPSGQPDVRNNTPKASLSEPPESEEDALAAHEDSLRHELASLRSMNAVISGITKSLEKAKSNMETVSATVNNASALLNAWTRILSQTEHNQRLILNPSWQGASQDLLDVENEEIQRRQEQERRVAEDERRARQREAEKEEEERRRALESGKGPRGKGGKSLARGATRPGGYVGVGGQGGVRGTAKGSLGRSESGIGRGTGASRGKGRGA